ncbi:hypothetical protein BKA83DRAFT_1437283 [Pisolithus microcarpus]|nr:hypothetical protein BKA83DRAFT_1437283 [Pisolithus microcarpus]
MALAEKRVGMDGLMECFAAVLRICVSRDDDLAWMCTMVVTSFGEALGNFGNKKKVNLHVCSPLIHLPNWISTLSLPRVRHSSAPNQAGKTHYLKPPKQLRDPLHRAGIDTLFSVEGLKQPPDTFLDHFCARARSMASLSFHASFLRVLVQ